MTPSQSNPPVNRYLRDPQIDDIDHALGRPVFPLRESYRNYYATEDDGELARRFDASPFWIKTARSSRMAFYSVTNAGRDALALHLSTLTPVRAFEVRYRGYRRIVPAATRSRARYSYFRDLREFDPDLQFAEFAYLARVRLAA